MPASTQISKAPKCKTRKPRARYTGQYHAGDAPGPEVHDIGPDARRSRLRTVVGHWELNHAYEQAMAADDERDRRKAMRAAVAVAADDVENSATGTAQESAV